MKLESQISLRTFEIVSQDLSMAKKHLSETKGNKLRSKITKQLYFYFLNSLTKININLFQGVSNAKTTVKHLIL